MHCDKKNVVQVTPIILVPYNNIGGDGMIHYTHWKHQQQGEASPAQAPPPIMALPYTKKYNYSFLLAIMLCDRALCPLHDV